GGHFTQAVGIRAVGGADDDQHIALPCQFLDRVLAVLGGIANIGFFRSYYGRIAAHKRFRYGSRGVHRERGLSHEREIVWILDLEPFDILDGFHQVHSAAHLSHGAFDFRVPGMTDHHYFAFALVHLGYFDVHFGDQRTGGIEHLEVSCGGISAHAL